MGWPPTNKGRRLSVHSLARPLMMLAVTRWTRMAPLLIAVALIAGTHILKGANKRIVLIAGRPSHAPGEHEFRAGSMLLQKAMGGVTGVTVDVITNGWATKTADGRPVRAN